MFVKRTLFVVGAGASYELNFPLGEQLVDQIPSLVGDVRGQPAADILDTLPTLTARYNVPRHRLLPALKAVANGVGFAASIDNFLDAHSHDEAFSLCGKLAIAKAIISAEQHSKIFTKDDRALKSTAVSETWLMPFFKMLATGVKIDDLSNLFANISIVCFNYDRSIRHFLHAAIMAMYSLTPQRAAEVLRPLLIIHPYGSLGPLPWQTVEPSIPYGDSRWRHLVDIAQNIQTFTEQQRDTEERFIIREQVQLAQRIVFLGFAYYRQNMKLLEPFESTKAELYGTAYGLSQSNRDVVTELVHATFKSPHYPILEDLPAHQFLKNFSRKLAEI